MLKQLEETAFNNLPLKNPCIDLGLPGGWCWGGLDWEFGTSRCNLLYTEWINSKVLL